MSFINFQSKEVNCKIVYFGTGMSGKTTNIQYIYQKTAPMGKSSMIDFGSENDRTLFFDFLPLEVGDVNGFNVRFHLYSAPGQPFYEDGRKMLFRGIDGIVFVVDSQVEKIESNIESFVEMEKLLLENGVNPNTIPIIFQWNKRDLPNIVSIEELNQRFNKRNGISMECIANTGEGVFETLTTLSKLIMTNLKGSLEES